MLTYQHEGGLNFRVTANLHGNHNTVIKANYSDHKKELYEGTLRMTMHNRYALWL